MKKKEITCVHYKGKDVAYIYPLINATLLICNKCNVKLLKEMKAQEKLEKSLKTRKLKRR